jgi:hypothetical protein
VKHPIVQFTVVMLAFSCQSVLGQGADKAHPNLPPLGDPRPPTTIPQEPRFPGGLGTEGHLSVSAGAIKVDSAQGTMQGVFSIGRNILIRGGPSIAAPGTGGACLVADLTSQGIGASTCSRDDQCSVSSKDAPAVIRAQWYGYCIAAPGEAKRCWTRPGGRSDLCRLSPAQPLIGVDNTVPAAPVLLSSIIPEAREARWMVHACINGYSNGKGNSACGDGKGPFLKSNGVPTLLSQEP